MSENYELKIIQESRLAELKEIAELDKLMSIKRRHIEAMAELRGSAPQEILWIIAFNQIVGRVNSQELEMSMEGMEILLDGIRDYKRLAANGIKVGTLESSYSSKSTVYVAMERLQLGDIKGVRTNIDRINDAIAPFEEMFIDYELILYFNTKDYQEYQLMVEEVESVEGLEYTAANIIEPSDMPEDAVGIKFIPNLSHEELIEQFMASFSIPSRHSKVFLDKGANLNQLKIDLADLLLIGTLSIRNMIIPETSAYIVAREATSAWLDFKDYKYVHEHVHDFFESPSVVYIEGLSPFFGLISWRGMEIHAVTLTGEDKGREQYIELNTDPGNESKYLAIKPVEDPAILRQLLIEDPNNTRDKLFMVGREVYRLTEVKQRKLKFMGMNTMIPYRRFDFEMTAPFTSVRLLSPYYYPTNYEQFINVPGVVPYGLPREFRTYMVRKASLNGAIVSKEKWFRPRNKRITPLLEALEIYNRSKLVDNFIDPLEGLTTVNIALDWSDLK